MRSLVTPFISAAEEATADTKGGHRSRAEGVATVGLIGIATAELAELSPMPTSCLHPSSGDGQIKEHTSMDDWSFATLTQKAAKDVSRRASLLTLGAAGLSAIVASPFTSEAKKGRKKHRRNQSVPSSPPVPPEADRCAPQVAPCQTFVTATCGISSTCPNQIQCCDLLGTCDASGFFACLAANQKVAV
jgi:hypothetical protein